MSFDNNGIDAVLRILQLIKERLSLFDEFDDVGPPPEPATVVSRAEWAAVRVHGFLKIREELLGLSKLLPSRGAGGLYEQVLFVKGHLEFVVGQRGRKYLLSWFTDRGVSLREMSRKRAELAEMSWCDLLRLTEEFEPLI